MVRFGEALAAEQEGLWKPHYLDYDHMKNELDRLVAHEADPSTTLPPGWAKSSDDFAKVLDTEIEKVVLFYLERQGQLAAQMGSLIRSSTSNAELADGCRAIGAELVKLMSFLEINIVAIRKVLKKHDKMVGSQQLMGNFLSTRDDKAESHLRQLSALTGVSAIAASIAGGLTAARGSSQQGLVQRSHTVFYGRFDRKDSFNEIRQAEAILSEIDEMRERVSVASGMLSTAGFLATQLEPGMTEPVAVEGREPMICTYLNHATTFFYMMNYYIVLPSSGQYAQELGMPASFSGAIVGCTPLAAQISAFAYSGWTNYSYRQPLLFTTGLVLLGNIFYVLALPLQSSWLLLLGRLSTGLGGSRGISRRYIADTSRAQERTAISAMFVSAGCVGTAAGPGIAAILSGMLGREEINAPFGLILNTATVPGFLMVVLWMLHFTLLLVFFGEPACRKNKSATSNVKVSKATRQPLIEQDKSEDIQEGVCSILGRDRAVQVCLLSYFVLKLVQEGVITSTPLVTGYLLGWGQEDTGSFVAVLGLLVLPLNFIMGYLSRESDDRTLMCAMQVMLCVGVLAVVVQVRSNTVSGINFVLGAGIIYCSASMLEGVTMSLLSKVTPPSLAKGICNSGLLSTEAGTLGRTCGNWLVVIVGAHVSLPHLAQTMFLPELMMCFLLLALTRKRFALLY